MVFAVREPSEVQELAGLPELVVEGLGEQDARALLASGFPGGLDEQVRDRIVAETRGNPLALLELPRGLTATELAGGFGLWPPMRCRGASRRAICGDSRRSRRTRGCCCWSRRRSPSAIRC